MPEHTNRTRIDILLAERGLAASRSRARDMLARGCVIVDNQVITKAGASFARDCDIAVNDPVQKYVSRAALKLISGLDATGFVVAEKYCLDLGASTGGFCQVLLERGAAHVMAVDVGHGQLHPTIAADDRITSLEGQNARHLTQTHFERSPEFIVSDMSFVSLSIAAEPALRLAAENANAILLVKPQFEVGKDGIGKGGLVRSKAIAKGAVDRVAKWFSALPGWKLTHLLPSPIAGGDGNEEYLLCGTKDG